VRLVEGVEQATDETKTCRATNIIITQSERYLNSQNLKQSLLFASGYVVESQFFFKTVRKSLQRSRFQFGRHLFLNILNILKPLSFEGSFHQWK
jgi:hypothetical protein